MSAKQGEHPAGADRQFAILPARNAAGAIIGIDPGAVPGWGNQELVLAVRK